MIRAALVALSLAGPAAAQTSAADILAALETPTTELEQLTSILEGADESKALVAMRMMLASGDPGMTRLALRAGLTSTSGVMRGVALEAYMEGQPTLMAFAEHAAEEAPPYFSEWMDYVGSLSSDTTGVFPIPVGPKVDGQACFSGAANPETCAIRVGGTEVSFLIGSAWGTARLNENGELVGSISRQANSRDFTGPIAVTIPLLGQVQ